MAKPFFVVKNILEKPSDESQVGRLGGQGSAKGKCPLFNRLDSRRDFDLFQGRATCKSIISNHLQSFRQGNVHQRCASQKRVTSKDLDTGWYLDT